MKNGLIMLMVVLFAVGSYAAAAEWTLDGTDAYYDDGNVGIGQTPGGTVALEVVGQIGPTNGSAAAPTHTFYSDANTGMYRSSSDALSFSTNGTHRMTISSSGNVGIGQLPGGTVALEVVGQIGPTNGDAAAPTHTFYSDPNTGMYRSAVDELSFSSAGTQRMVIQADGDVGIGDSSPDYEFELENNQDADTVFAVTNTNSAGTSSRADIAVYRENASNGMCMTVLSPNYSTAAWQDAGVLGTNSGLSGGLRIMSTTGGINFETTTPGSTKMTILGNGDVGIGTNSPACDLDVRNQVQISDGTTTGQYVSTGGNHYIGTITNHSLNFQTNNTANRMVITGAGKVGIGDSSPDYEFELENNQDGDTVFAVTNTNSLGTSSRADVAVYRENASNGMSMTVLSPNYSTAAWQDAGVIGTNSGLSGGLRIMSTTGGINFETTTPGSTKMTILGNGNVGIGEDNPSSKLDIVGDLEVGGTDFFVDDSTGRVGIGTSSPDTPLEIEYEDGSSADTKTLLTLTRTAPSTALANLGSKISFDLENSTGTVVPEAASISGEWDSSTATLEDGRLVFSVMSGGSASEKVRIKDNGQVAIGYTSIGADDYSVVALRGALFNANTAATAYDFIVNGETADNLFCIDASEDEIGLFHNVPDCEFHIKKSEAGPVNLKVENSNGDDSADAVAYIKTTATGGDPKVVFEVNSTGADWSVGINNDNTNVTENFEVCKSTAIGTNTKLKIEEDGSIIVPQVYSDEDSENSANVYVDSNGQLWRASSSKKYKENIRPLEFDYRKVMKLTPKTYETKRTGKTTRGLIAEEAITIDTSYVLVGPEGPEGIQTNALLYDLLEVVKDHNESLSTFNGSFVDFNSNEETGVFTITPEGLEEGSGIAVDSEGKFGVGTDSPISIAHVKGISEAAHDAQTAAGLVVENTSPGVASQISFKAIGDEYESDLYENAIAKMGAVVKVDEEENLSGELVFSTLNGDEFEERVRIAGNGNVGIGTNEPEATLDSTGTTLLGCEAEIEDENMDENQINLFVKGKHLIVKVKCDDGSVKEAKIKLK